MKKEINYTLAFIAIIGMALCTFTLVLIDNYISIWDMLSTIFICIVLYIAFEQIIKHKAKNR